MKITKPEKFFLIMIVLSISFVVYSVNKVQSDIREHGGLKNIIIEVGKGIKDISKQIGEKE